MRFEKFEDLLDQDLSWRKREISELYMLAQRENKEVLLKSLILLLYAHWEGYIKKASKLYLVYVSYKNIPVDRLSENFRAIMLRNHISNCLERSEDFTLENELTFIKMYEKASQKFKVDVSVDDDMEASLIDTKHNLKDKIFRRIIRILGLHYKPSLETKKNYIDLHLLANRNSIGHGSAFNQVEQQEFTLSISDIGKLKAIIIQIIDSFRDELLAYADQELYLLTNSAKREAYENDREAYLQKEFKVIESLYRDEK